MSLFNMTDFSKHKAIGDTWWSSPHPQGYVAVLVFLLQCMNTRTERPKFSRVEWSELDFIHLNLYAHSVHCPQIKWRKDEVKLRVSDHSTLLNIGLSVLVFMHWSKKYLLVSINCLILLGVALEAGIDCANTQPKTYFAETLT